VLIRLLYSCFALGLCLETRIFQSLEKKQSGKWNADTQIKNTANKSPNPSEIPGKFVFKKMYFLKKLSGLMSCFHTLNAYLVKLL
jgi:hypothetical protein